MKKKLFTLITLPFILAGCSNHTGIKTSEALAYIKTFDEDPTITEYSFEYKYTFYDEETKKNKTIEGEDFGELHYNPVPGEDLDFQLDEDVSKSYFFEMPLTLNASNFYLLTDGALDLNNCMYGIISMRLTYPSGTISHVYINKTENGGIKFESFNSFVNVAVYTLDVDSIRGRIDGIFEFNKNGLLVRECIQSVGFNQDKAANDITMFKFEAKYSY
jgi:uncharacterized lipoprotein NlpE involved in copper resistance